MAAFVEARISANTPVASDNQYASEIARLQRTAAESRLKVVESQVALAFTMCAITETEIRYRRLDDARKMLKKVQHHAEIIGIHVDEPDHLPKAAVSRLRMQLAELKKRVEVIESRLHQG